MPRRTLAPLILTLLLVLSLVPVGAWAQDEPPSAPATGPTEDAVAAMLLAARTLKQQRPNLFGRSEGVLAVEILPDGQGAAAGIQPGDVLIAYGDTPLDSIEQLVAVASKTPVEQGITLHCLRAGEPREARVQGGRIGVVVMGVAETEVERIQTLMDSENAAFLQGRDQEALERWEQGLALAKTLMPEETPGLKVTDERHDRSGTPARQAGLDPPTAGTP